MNLDRDRLDELVHEAGAVALPAALGEPLALVPSADLREAVLRRVAATPRRQGAATAPPQLYAARVEALRRLLATLTADEWQRPAAPYTWSVHGLVAHLLVIERYTASVLGLCEAPDGATGDHLALGSAVIDQELREQPIVTAQRWSETAATIIEHVAAEGFDLDSPLPLHGWSFSASTALVARSFELWTHAEDIGRARRGAPVPLPPAADLRTMSSVSVHGLPHLLPFSSSGAAMAPCRIVLTGEGGGTFDLGGTGERAALVVVDVVDYCRAASRRLALTDLERTVEGDRTLVDALLRAASAFAV